MSLCTISLFEINKVLCVKQPSLHRPTDNSISCSILNQPGASEARCQEKSHCIIH